MKEARRRSHTKWDCKYHMVLRATLPHLRRGVWWVPTANSYSARR